jgi:cytochrome c oxidase subunit 2
MGLVLLIVIWLITFVSSYFFLAKTWWLPTGASAAAAGIDHQFATTYVPVNREVEVILRAHDVIHSIFIPAMRFKQDAVPGLAIHMHFTPITTGDYDIFCAELCGLGHYRMHGMLKVVSQREYDKWLAAREAEKQ